MKLFNKYKFSDKSQALGGLISTAMGILSLLSFGYGVYLSFKAAGEGGLRVGSLGILPHTALNQISKFRRTYYLL